LHATYIYKIQFIIYTSAAHLECKSVLCNIPQYEQLALVLAAATGLPPGDFIAAKLFKSQRTWLVLQAGAVGGVRKRRGAKVRSAAK
jgi:hypothetical protein